MSRRAGVRQRRRFRRPKAGPSLQREKVPSNQRSNLSNSQSQMLQLQNMLGNQAVSRMVQDQRKSNGAPTIQRNGIKKALESETGEAVRGAPSVVGDYLGTGTVGPTVDAVQQGSNYQAPQGMEGFHMGGAAPDTATPIVGGGIGMFMNFLNVGQHSVGLVTSVKESGKLAGQMGEHHARMAQGEEELFAATKILEEKYQATNTKFVDSFLGLASGINGVINGLTTILSSALSAGSAMTAAMAAAATFAIGAGLTAITGTISAIRDFTSAYKKKKRKDAMSAMIDVYDQSLKHNQKKVTKLEAKVKYPDTDPNKFYNDVLKLAEVKESVKNTELMLKGLMVAKRKQGFKTKLFSGGVSLGAAAGGAALLAATLGAVAATPVGWALAATAALVTIGLVIGMKVKRNIRKENVERMRTELEMIEDAVDSGQLKDSDPWSRSYFEEQGLKRKGALRRAFTKSKKSGKITVGARKAEIEAYLAKYDTKAAGEVVWEGFKRTLTTDEGKVKVDNPAYKNPKKTPDIPKKITVRQQLEEFIKHQTGDVEKFKKSMFDPAQEDAAKELLLGKMKLSFEKKTVSPQAADVEADND